MGIYSKTMGFDKKISVLVADDEQNGRMHITNLLSEYPDIRIDAKIETGTQLVSLLAKKTFDLAFIDIDMPEMTGLEALHEASRNGYRLPFVIFVTTHAHHAVSAFDLGAVDYLIKPVSAARLNKAIEKFKVFHSSAGFREASVIKNFRATYNLTPREAEICELVLSGLLREDIQTKLGLSPSTLKSHLASIYQKCGFGGDDGGRGDKFSRLVFLLFKSV